MKYRNRPGLSESHPNILEEWDYEKNEFLKPEDVSFGSHEKVWWICKRCGNSWFCSIYVKTGRKTGNNGCPFCSGRKPFRKNNLLFDNPDMCKEWDTDKNGSLQPGNVTPYSHRKVWWRCNTCGYSWRAAVSNRNSLDQKCPACQPFTSIITDRNRLSTNFPVMAKEWDMELNSPLSPDDVSYWDIRKVWWQCQKCGNRWQAIICSRAKGRGHGHGCRNCSIGPVSRDSQRWLDEIGVKIREVKIIVNSKIYIADGFDPETNTIYEFLGDYWHGNPIKYDPNMKHPVSKKTFGELYLETLARIKTLQEAGYNLVYIWESEWRQLKRKLKKSQTSK